MLNLVGQSLGQYEIHDQIGAGGMATVFRATQRSIGREVALKVISQPGVRHQEQVDRFLREVEIIANLQHPHILPIYDFGEQDGYLYVVMGYLGAGTLADRMKLGSIELDEAARFVRQISSALEYAHSRGIIHRDIKPTNVLLDAQGNAYVVDFGLAKATETESKLTGTSIVGTPHYMAPEMIEPESITTSVDIYALGITLFEMLAGEVPFNQKNPLAMMMAHAQQPVPNILDKRSDLPPEIQSILETAMGKTPDQRYRTSSAFADALDVLVKGSSTTPEVDTTASLLFTDIDGNVIFVDTFFLKLTGRPSSAVRSLVGQPAHKVLGIDKSEVEHWLGEASKIGQMHPHTVTIKDTANSDLHMLISGSATYDERGKCIGVDFTLRYAATEPGTEAPHLSTPSTVFDTQQKQQVEVYFAAQIDAMRVLLVRLGGPKLAQHLEEIINDTAETNDWPVSMNGSEINTYLAELRLDVYRALLAKATMYASKVIGAKVVQKQVGAVENQLGGSYEGMGATLGLNELLQSK